MLAWQWYEKGYVDHGPIMWSKTLSLGVNVTSTQVWQAMCSDYSNVYGTKPLTISAETLAAAYYGWRFTGDPVSEFQMQGCPAD